MGHELVHEALSEALDEQTDFTADEWAAFGIGALQSDHYVKSLEGLTFEPAESFTRREAVLCFLHSQPYVEHHMRTLMRELRRLQLNPHLNPDPFRTPALTSTHADTHATPRYVSDEVKRRDRMTHLSYTDFLEALVRLSALKPLPSPAILKQYEAKSCAHFFEQASAPPHLEPAHPRARASERPPHTDHERSPLT